jgi:chemotaxis signal transduction protein
MAHRETPISEITLRRYEKPYSASKRELLKKCCLSLGLLQPGDSRDVIVDILYILLEAKQEGAEIVATDLEIGMRGLYKATVFQAGGEWLGLPIDWVREVQPLDRVTRVPNAPPGVLGILNLRGRVLTLLDLAGCLGMAPGSGQVTHVVVMDLPDPELCLGLAVQRIVQVRQIQASAIDLPLLLPAIKPECSSPEARGPAQRPPYW